MSENANPSKGYYSILQYVHDPERSEGANVGIVLFCPEKSFIRAQTATGNDRVKRFFSRTEGIELDFDRINALKIAFEERVCAEAGRMRTFEEFRHFVDSRANQLLLTPPRPIKIADPEAELAELFEVLVGGRRRRRAEPSPEDEIIVEFDRLLAERGAAGRVQRGFTVESRLLDRTLVFPVAFRNGSINVVQPVAFPTAKDRGIDRACQLAVEGNDLLNRPDPIKLNVLGSFDGSPESEWISHVRAVLEKYGAKLHTADEADVLVDEIALTAHSFRRR
jgi:hypothetical protein